MNDPATTLSSLPLPDGPTLNRTASSAQNASSAKLNSSAKEFESILLTTWLQSAETSFASAPTPDDDQADGEEQVMSFATQQLAKAWTDAGGIGIAAKVAKALASAADQGQEPKVTAPAVSR